MRIKILSVCFILFIAYFIFLFVSMPHLSVLSNDQADFQLVVERGDSLYDVKNALRGKTHPFLVHYLNIRMYIEKTGSFLKPGIWTLNTEMSFNSLYQNLLVGNERLVKITIPPGWGKVKLSKRLEASGFGSSKSIQLSIDNFNLEAYGYEEIGAQGFLFPETYLVPESYNIDQVIAFFVVQFFTELKLIYPDYNLLSAQELLEKVTLASIVEGEYRQAEEASMIATVFYNRLRNNRKLESCATILYVLEEERGEPHRTRLFYKDLEIKSDYNTYMNVGLPPKPINGPGRTALEAVFNPIESNNFFFVVDNSKPGFHVFSEKWKDHKSAAEAYISGFRAKNTED